MRRAALTATGRYFPARKVPNSYFYEELGLDTNEEWIRSRTGIHSRHHADIAGGESTSHLAAGAARICLERAGLSPLDLDGIVVATVTPDQTVPSTACLVQEQIGARHAWAWDIGAACSGYVFALAQVTAMVRSGMARRVLVIGAETMSAILDFRDRDVCILFGDGAGATLVEDREVGGLEIVDFRLHSDGAGAPLLQVPAGGARRPASATTVDQRLHYLQQDGRAVFKHAVTRISEVILELLVGNGLGVADVRLVVPHQANIRIIDACVRRLGIAPERVIITVEQWANTTAATIPTTLDYALEHEALEPGDHIVLAAFGAGFTWGSALLRV